MPRIPDEHIERLKADIAVQRLVEGMGITLKRHGADLMGLCPFHDDKNPSLAINPKTNLWHCLGACNAGGSVIDWVMKAEGVSFRHATELLLADYMPSSLVASANVPKRSSVQKLPTNLQANVEDQRLLNQVIDYYHQTLKQSPEALAYVEKRGLSAEAINHFKLGYANRTLGYRLPEKNRKEGAAIRGQLQRIGLYRSSGHEHFSGSLVIPVINEAQVLEVYGRKILSKLRKGTPLHLYLPGPHKGVFNSEALLSSKEIILCESLIDALTFWSAGYRNVTTSYGVNGFTDELLAAFKQHSIERILIAYDRDEAGEKAATDLAKMLIKEGIDCYRVQFPKNMDANEYALSVQPAEKSLGVVIRSAIWLGRGEAPNREPEPVVELLPVMLAEEKTEAVAENIEPEIPLPSSVIPESPKPDIVADISEREIVITLGNRRYRVRGLENNHSFNALKINLLITAPAFDNSGESLHVDTFDLYQQRPRSAFIKQAAIELGMKDDVIKADVGQLLLKLEALQEQHINAEKAVENKTVQLSDAEQQQAIALLQSPDLLQRIQTDFSRCGIVGESSNTLVGYLASVSRKLSNPLAVIIQSTSAAGKSSLMDAVLNLMPEEERVHYSAMTGQSLFYMGETNLKNKILAIAEEAGAEQASYALKLLQSEGELTIASTGKDESSGDLVTKEYRVEGPVMLFLTTTAIDIDEELLNRCIVLTVNEAREQTQAIHQLQRKKRTLQGLIQKTEKQNLLQLHRNAQRLLKSLHVVNPFADQLTFIDTQTRTRRDHEKYLTLIDSLALLHQHQRTIKTVQHNGEMLEYIEVELSDIEMANQLAHEVLGRTLDELPPQTRKLLTLIDESVTKHCAEQSMKRGDYRFSRRDVREFTGWSDNQLKVHCSRLQDMEYLLVHRGGRGHSIEYELLYDGSMDTAQRHLMGLIDSGALKQQYDGQKLGVNDQKSGSSWGQVAPKLASSCGAENSDKENNNNNLIEPDEEAEKKALFRSSTQNPSYAQPPVLVAKGH